ncbi:hypothetical protein CspHIS471_0600390 [Cutaneotrichosporon sp. HIS471]|nr:hypothetical protein CspHIS471_0600390 [Cutaneotrichosporon sp. HIS471]
MFALARAYGSREESSLVDQITRFLAAVKTPTCVHTPTDLSVVMRELIIERSEVPVKLALANGEFETASLIRLFLQLASGGSIAVERFLPNWDNWAMFVKKKRGQPTSIMKYALENAIRQNKVICSHCFTVAAILHDDAMCNLILEVMASRTLPVPGNESSLWYH